MRRESAGGTAGETTSAIAAAATQRMTARPRGWRLIDFDSMRVLEIAYSAAAPFCGKLFASWGAEVVKVELPAGGESSAATVADDALDRYLNAGKQRVALDYRTSEGATLLGRLAEQCDVLVTDAPPATVDELALLDLGNATRPAVRTSITPFGLSGPYRDFEATPATLLAMGGYSFLMGDAGAAPLTMPGWYPHYQAGLFAYTATVAAGLAGRDRPQVIEVSILEALAALHQHTTVQYTYGGQLRTRHGNRWGAIHPITILPCKDGWFGMGIVPNFWEPFTMLLGREELITDPRFATPVARVEHEDELDELIVEAVADRTKQELLVEGQETWRVPVATVANLAEVLDDRHLAERGFWQTVQEQDGATVRYPGTSFRLVGADPRPQPPAAGPGAHTDQVCASLLGIDRAEREALASRGVI